MLFKEFVLALVLALVNLAITFFTSFFIGQVVCAEGTRWFCRGTFSYLIIIMLFAILPIILYSLKVITWRILLILLIAVPFMWFGELLIFGTIRIGL